MSPSRRPSRRVPPKGRSLRSDPRPDPFADSEFGGGDNAASTVETGGGNIRPGSRAANRAAKRAVTGVRPKTQVRGGSARSSRSNTPLLLLAIGAIVVVGAVIALGNPFGAGAPVASPTPSGDLTVGDGTCPIEQPASLPAGETRTVTITTPKGDIVIAIDGALSPIAAGNVVALATCHFYDGSVFHRTAALEDGTPFVIQGGEAKAGTGDIPYTIKDETVTALYKRGTVAMARTSQPNSQSSQFFIVLDDKAEAPLKSYNTYAIFGTVIAGMDVADAIFSASGGAETPSNPVPMTKVTVGPGPVSTASPAPSTAPSAAPSAAASTMPTTAP